jgi:hypothetical protein
MSNPSFVEVDAIRNRLATGEDFDAVSAVVSALGSCGIRARQRDGELTQVNLSLPTSVQDAIVIGLRYVKADGSLTEDHYLCNRNLLPGQSGIVYFNKRGLETLLPEYKDTHKQQSALVESGHFVGAVTHANTISLLK